MANDNPRWSRRRIANELAMLGYRVDKNTVAKYMPKPSDRPRRPRSQTWGTFVRNHLHGTLAIDFFTVPTARFEVLYVFVVLSLERRCILHVNVTAHPSAEWTAQQMVEAVGYERFETLIRDRDGIYGAAFDRRVNHLGITQVRIAPRSPWQNGYVERLVGTFRREVVDHLIVLNELHLLRRLREYMRYYNEDRPHLSLDGDAPARRVVEPSEKGNVESRSLASVDSTIATLGVPRECGCVFHHDSEAPTDLARRLWKLIDAGCSIARNAPLRWSARGTAPDLSFFLSEKTGAARVALLLLELIERDAGGGCDVGRRRLLERRNRSLVAKLGERERRLAAHDP